MLVGVIADDFTGAGDIANTLAKGYGPDGGLGGLIVAQYMGIPNVSASKEIEAGVISLKTRSSPAEEAVALSLAALAWLKTQGCQQIIFKYCSTFDSTREGNIGPVAEALANALGAKGVVACPAFPTAGRTVYQGHLFVKDRLLHESGMEKHPLTPMTDSNLRRWLSYQTTSEVGLVASAAVREGASVVRASLADAAGHGQTLVIVDATSDEDLVTIGEASVGAPLITGGSGIALHIPTSFIRRGLAKGNRVSFAGTHGPEAILAGSCSGATRNQIAVHARNHPVMNIPVDGVMAGEIQPVTLVEFVRKNEGMAPLVYSSSTPEQVVATQNRFGREAVAARLDALFAETARQLVGDGIKRLVVAGGETSGAVAQALDLGDLLIGPEIDPGVPIVISEKRHIALAFKSGNFGRPEFFAHALSELEGRTL